MKKPVLVFTIADKNNFQYALTMLKTLRKFHDWPVYLYTDVTDNNELCKLPKDVTRQDLTPFLADPAFFYRATPMLAEPLLDDYELVLKLDADQLILGSLDYIKDTTDYDIGTVINWNRHDEKFYPLVDLRQIGVFAVEYFNCGFVAMRSKKFVHTWGVWCFSPNFDRCQYKEQDGLNILCYSGNWNVRCFDLADGVAKHFGWYGLISKGEWSKARVEDGKIVVDKGQGDQPFPPEKVQLHAVHMAGGAGSKKDNWSAFFPPEVMDRIGELVK